MYISPTTGERNILSEIEEVRGTEPVSSTTIIPSVNKASPSDLAKYSSIAVIPVRTH